MLRSIHWANVRVKPVPIVWTIGTMWNHHLIAVAFVIHVIGIASEKPASIIIVYAHLWLTATTSPGIRNVWENTCRLLIEIKYAWGWIKVKGVVVPDNKLHGELVVYLVIIDWIQLLLRLKVLIINLQRHWYLMIFNFFLPTQFCRRSLLILFYLDILFGLIVRVALTFVISLDLLIIPYFIFMSDKVVPCSLIFAEMTPCRGNFPHDLRVRPLRVFFL
jgi:hypothetical protein